MKISHTTDIIKNAIFSENLANITLEIDNFTIYFEIFLNYIEVLRVFNENLKLIIEQYGKLDKLFGASLWAHQAQYRFELSCHSYMTIELKGYGISGTTIIFKISELEDLKEMYKCLTEIYELMDNENIPDRYKMEFQ